MASSDPLELVLDSRVRIKIPEGGLPRGVRDQLVAIFSHDNPAFHKLKNMRYSTKGEPRVIHTWAQEPSGYLTFPRGGLARVRHVLKEAGLTWMISDQRVEGSEELDVEYLPPGEVAPYQTEAMLTLHAKQNALLRAPTSSRKTSIAMMLAARCGLATLALVDTTALADQWKERVVSELGIPPGEVGQIFDGEFRLKPFTIGMHASIVSRAKKPEDRRRMIRYFGCVIGDEIQGAAAARAMESIDMFPAKYRFGISASEKRKDGKEFLIYDLFGKVAYEIDREYLVEIGIILDVEIRVLVSEFEAPWYGHPDSYGGDEEKDLDFNRLLDEMQRDDARNALVVNAVKAEVDAGEQAVILAHRRDHCRLLDSMFAARSIRSGFLIGGADFADEFARTKEELRSREVRVGIGTMKAIGQGIDMPSVGVGAIATPLAGNRERFNQARGRLCRKPEGKTRAVMYYCLDPAVYPTHLRNLVAWNPTVRVFERGEWRDAEGSALWERCASRKKPKAFDLF
jgi:superfamily II DNA or RNA helicase